MGSSEAGKDPVNTSKESFFVSLIEIKITPKNIKAHDGTNHLNFQNWTFGRNTILMHDRFRAFYVRRHQ